MKKVQSIHPSKNELPSHYADRLGTEYTATVTAIHKKLNGQFFTPPSIANFMASLATPVSGKMRLLDPGCGIGILSIALIEELVQAEKKITVIELTAYETDLQLKPFTEKAFSYLQKWLVTKNIAFKFTIHTDDFIIANIGKVTPGFLKKKSSDLFDFVISNPPYFKLPKDDERVKATKGFLSGQTNIYSLFMAMSSKLLNTNGQLIFIIPRSFTSGSYFKEFRKSFFELISTKQIHLFDSRKDTFGRDNVLQETMIISGIVTSNPTSNEIIISSSHGIKDIEHPAIKVYPEKKLINFSSEEKILHLPVNDMEESIVELFKSWKGSLKKYNIQISTGPVVAFRSWDYIYEHYRNGTVFLAPLFWLHNINKMSLEWPLPKPKKGQYISIQPESKSMLILNKNYILLRRFSSKDDKSRLIAAPYFSNYIDSDYIGVENKVNYIYRPDGYLDRNEVVGLCALLNSELFDNYFRIFNGNVNVSATELREMALPPLEMIKEFGNRIILSNNYATENVNEVINELFSLEEVLNK